MRCYRGGNVVHSYAEGVGGAGEGAVLVHQVHGHGVGIRAVGVGVRLDAVAGVGVAPAVTPVDDVAAYRVSAGVGDAAQRQRVSAALADLAGTANCNGRRHVTNHHGKAGAPDAAALVRDADGHGVGAVVGVGMAARPEAALGGGAESGLGTVIAPGHRDRPRPVVHSGVAERPEAEVVTLALVTALVRRGRHCGRGVGNLDGGGVLSHNAVFVLDLAPHGARAVIRRCKARAAAGAEGSVPVAEVERVLEAGGGVSRSGVEGARQR